MFVWWAPQPPQTGDSGVAAGFDTCLPLNIPTQLDPTSPFARAGIHQNQILTADPLLPDSGRSGSELIFGPCDGAPFPPGLPHETAVAWVRNREAKTKPREPWKETRGEYTTRLRGICQDINGHYNVEDLCRSFPRRLQELVDKEGDRINR